MGNAFIWDLDGTLLDSYDVIVESLYQSFSKYDIHLSREQIHQYAIAFSSSALIEHVSEEKGIDPQLLYDSYAQFSRENYRLIKLMPNAITVLGKLSSQGAMHYVFTHRGLTTVPVLKMLGIDTFFQEILTSKSGFARKPAPDALLYLIEKYNLTRESSYYVGDRSLDMESAKNAGIAGILYLPEGSPGTPSGAERYIVSDLIEILEIK